MSLTVSQTDRSVVHCCSSYGRLGRVYLFYSQLFSSGARINSYKR